MARAADELDALELARRVAASDVGTETVGRSERVVDDLDTRYSVTPPAQLMTRVRRYLTYSSSLLYHSLRKTLDEHRRLVVVSAWPRRCTSTSNSTPRPRRGS